MAHFVPTNSSITVEETSDLYLKNIFKSCRLPEDIISD